MATAAAALASPESTLGRPPPQGDPVPSSSSAAAAAATAADWSSDYDTDTSDNGAGCVRCLHKGCDVRFLPCGCTVHARCFPLHLLSDYTSSGFLPHSRVAMASSNNNQQQSGGVITSPLPRSSSCCFCPLQPTISSVELFPLSFDDLERAGELRCQDRRDGASALTCSSSAGKQQPQGGDDIEGRSTLAKSAPFLGLSYSHPSDGTGRGGGGGGRGGGRGRGSNPPYQRTSSSTSSSRSTDDVHRRTGRWTSEETSYVESLVRCFEMGRLPLPQGLKLNEFLSDVLMCKPSRLTKKMKNAKLSTRSYRFGDWSSADAESTTTAHQYCSVLSQLEAKFLESIHTEHERLELKFNLQRIWRTQLSNLCLQVGFPSLDCESWLSSLEEMERRGADAEEAVRRAQRRRMGLALQRDAMAGCGLRGVFIGGLHGRDAAEVHGRGLLVAETPSPLLSSSVEPDGTTSSALALDVGATTGAGGYVATSMMGRSRTDSMYLSTSMMGRSRTDSMTLPVTMRSRSGSIAAPCFPTPAKDSLVPDGSAPSFLTESSMASTNGGNGTTTQAEMEFLNELFRAEQANDLDAYLAVADAGIEGNKHRKLNSSAEYECSEMSIPATLAEAKEGRALPPPRQNILSTTSMVSIESMRELADDESASMRSRDDRNLVSGGAYLDLVIRFLEKINAPFMHADIWVPSFLPSDSYDGTDAYDTNAAAGGAIQTQQQNQELRLCHAGHATRTDLSGPADTVSNFIEFGEYSSHWSFSIGKGAPGRVYSTGVPAWENNVDNESPEHFKRCGGAKLYGIKTLVAFPVACRSVGRIVVVLYSSLDVERDINLVKKIYFELQKHNPEPHWRLVVDVGPTIEQDKVEEQLDARSFIKTGELEGQDHSPSPIAVDYPSSVDEGEEHEIVSLLGEYLPTDTSPTGPSGALIASTMSLRLLLLRFRGKRSTEENDRIEVIKKSYRSYSRSNKNRKPREIANLLARDWSFLSPQVDSKPSKARSNSASENDSSRKPPPPSLVTPRTDTKDLVHVDHRHAAAACPMPLQKAPEVQSNISSQDGASAMVGDMTIKRTRTISTISDQGPPTPSAAGQMHSFHHGNNPAGPS